MENEMMMRGMTPFETYMVANKESRRSSGVGVAGLVLGSVGTALAVGSWIFAPIFANAKANAAKDIATAQNAGTATLLNNLASLLNTERAERVAGDVTLNQTITDTVSGSQQGTLTAQQAAELSAVQSVQNNLFSQAVMGNLSENAQKVQLYSAPQPCSCPGSCQ